MAEDIQRVPYETASDGVVVVGNEEGGDEKTFVKRERDTWNTRFDFLLALIGFSVGLGNVWRFPYLCYKHGGGAFLVPYLICVVIGGMPLLFLEIAIGQFMQQGGINVWNIMPVFRGIGFATTIIVFFLNCYYNVILAWTFFYMFSSMNTVLPWASCDNEWNTDNCTQLSNTNLNFTNQTDPATEYWERRVLGIHLSQGVQYAVGIKWDLCLCLLLAWIVVYFCIWKGIRTSGKVMYFTATAPYILMVVLLVRGCTLPGAINGIKFYILPEWNKMLNTEVWVAAGTQIFFSYSISLGTLTALGSYNKYRHNSYRDSFLFALANSGTSILAGFVIFSILGYMATKLGVPVDKAAKAGPGLAFVAYPQAVAEMPISPLWAVLFFFMVILLGLDSQFVGVEGLVTAISDLFPSMLKKGNRKEIFVLILCIISFFIGLSMVTHGGMYVFQMFDYYSGSRVILLVAFFQLIGISWCYGVRRFYNDLENMLGFTINPYMGFSWLISAPSFCLIMFGFVLSKYEELRYDVYEYPREAIIIAWIIACISIVMIPIVAAVVFGLALREKRDVFAALRYVFTPQIPSRGLTDDELNDLRLTEGAVVGKTPLPAEGATGGWDPNEKPPRYEVYANEEKSPPPENGGYDQDTISRATRL